MKVIAIFIVLGTAQIALGEGFLVFEGSGSEERLELLATSVEDPGRIMTIRVFPDDTSARDVLIFPSTTRDYFPVGASGSGVGSGFTINGESPPNLGRQSGQILITSNITFPDLGAPFTITVPAELDFSYQWFNLEDEVEFSAGVLNLGGKATYDFAWLGGDGFQLREASFQFVPEPSSLSLMLACLFSAMLRRRRRR